MTIIRRFLLVGLSGCMLLAAGCEHLEDLLPRKPKIVTDVQGREISALDPFARKTIQVGDAPEEFISYIDEGSGDPIVFLHGAPSFSYLWRNVIPHVSDQARIIAPDWMGYGNSGKPEVDYRYLTHLQYLDRFIEKLDLHNITFVLHDWSPIVAFSWAFQHQDRVKAFVTMEAFYFPVPNDDVLPPEGQFLRSAEGERAIVEDNYFINTQLPGFVIRPLRELERRVYAHPWEQRKDRRPLVQVPQDLPIGGQPADLWEVFTPASQWFAASDLPKLFIYAEPGALVTTEVPNGFPASVVDVVSGLPNTTTVRLDEPASHFLMEDHPHEVGEAIADWWDTL